MRRTERFGLRPCFKDGSVLPHRVGRIECVILSFRAFEEVKFYKAWHLIEVTIARNPDLLERCFGPLGNAETVHHDKHGGLLPRWLRSTHNTKQSARLRSVNRGTNMLRERANTFAHHPSGIASGVATGRH